MQTSGASWFTVIPAAVVAVAPAPALATVYMSVEQAQQAMFPGQRLAPRFARLQPSQAAAIKKASE